MVGVPENNFDILIIGAGPAGYVAAIRAAQRQVAKAKQFSLDFFRRRLGSGHGSQK
jgi:thioredoxin reductase